MRQREVVGMARKILKDLASLSEPMKELFVGELLAGLSDDKAKWVLKVYRAGDCQNCGKPLKHADSWAKYCSAACRQSAYRARKAQDTTQ